MDSKRERMERPRPTPTEGYRTGGSGGDGGEWFVIAVIVGILMGIFSASCRTVKYVPVEKTVTDSVFFRDTVVQQELVPYRDSVSLPDTTSYLSNLYAYSRATWSGGRLHHVLGIWPQAKVDVKVPSYAVRVRRVATDRIVEVEKKLTWWQQKKLDCAGISIGLNVLLLSVIFWIVRTKRLI